MRQLTRFIATICTIFLLAGSLAAQEYRGRVLGRATDPSGAVVPQAEVKVVNTATNVPTASRTNSDGNFLVILEPGTYNITVEAAGFKTKVISGIVVRAGDQLAMDVPLQVGSASETVTVNGEAPQLETASASISQVVERRFLDLLFIPGRNPLNLVSLTPGVSQNGNPVTTDSQQNQFAINGGGGVTGGNEIVVDGGSVVMPRQRGAMANSPSGDTVEELRVQTTMFDAAFGHTSGGVVTYATRGGTNQLHGSFEGFYRDKVFNANGWTNNKYGLQRPDDSRKFFSGAVGGPVYLPKIYDGRNRTFFFFSGLQESRQTPVSFLGRTMTEQEKGGDFSSTLNSRNTALLIYDPSSTVVNGSTATRQLFPGARVPSARFNAVGEAIAKQYPGVTVQGTPQIGVNNWALATAVSEPDCNYSVRLDQLISSRQRLFGRFGIMRSDQAVDGLPRGFMLLETNYAHFWSGSLNDDFTFSPTFLGTFRYNFGRYGNGASWSSLKQDPAELKLPDIILKNALVQAWPRTRLGEGLLGLGGRVKFRINDTHAITPSFTKLMGNHTVRFGADLRMINWNSIELGYGMTGDFTWNNTFTRSDPFTASTGNTTGTSMASLLLGTPASGAFGSASPYSLRQYYYATYLQDDWKVTSRLTLNLGMRWEMETPYQERFDRTLYGFDFTSPAAVKVPGYDLRGGTLFAGIQGNPRWQGNLDKNNFGPRIGIAYRIGKETVIRTGYALFYSPTSALLDTSTGVPVTYNQNATYIGSTDSNATPYTNLSNPFPAGIPPILGNSEGRAARLGDSVSFIDQARVSPYTQQFQFAVQHTLPGRIKVEAAFLRMMSLKGLDSFDLNEKPDQYRALGAAENTRVPNPFFGIFPATSAIGTSNTVAQRQLWLAYPQYTSVSKQGSSTHMASNNALQLSMEKRLSHGLTVLANYSISKLIENNITSLVNTRHYRAISALDRAHVVNTAWVYDLPFGKGRAFGNGWNGVGGFLASNWTISGRLYLASGVPLSISDTNGRPIRLRDASKSGSVADRLGDRVDPLTKQVLNPYFDTTAFQSLATQYAISPEVPYFGELRAPGTRNVDLSIVKRFRLWERFNVDVRADAANASNTPRFDAPGTDLSNAGTFGVINSAGPGRNVQLAFRMVF